MPASHSFELGGGPATVGLLAAYPLGTSAGAILFGRWVSPERRLQVMSPLAIIACGILMLCAARPGLTASLLIFTLSGAASCYHLAASTAFFTAVPDAMRGRAYGIAQAGLSIGQGAGVQAAGAELWPPTTLVAATGVLGAAMALPLTFAWHRARVVDPT